MDPLEKFRLTYSRPDLVAVTHTSLELTVNFERHVLEGKATLTVRKKTSTCSELVLDTYKLDILEVKDNTGNDLTKTLENHEAKFGSKLIINLPNEDNADCAVPTSSKQMNVLNEYQIQIKYKTSQESPALYWLKPRQTSDGTCPLLISNSKLMYARAIFPCQDTPSNKITFSSVITVPNGFNVIMPGFREKCIAEASFQDQYEFSLIKPWIRPHEICIIVGSFCSLQKKIKCGRTWLPNFKYNLWAEQEYFVPGEMAIDQIMEVLCTIKDSYGFSTEVNVYVLPPNMPEFDMQNPNMTFVSSTVIEGHYSMTDTIVQNIIESWIAREVEIDDFKYLWLIKGLSTFIHRNPINGIFEDLEIYEFIEIKGLNNLLRMEQLNVVSLIPVFTEEILPMNIIKYVSEKGWVFLNYLQKIIDHPPDFKSFLVRHFIYKDVVEDIKDSLYERFKFKRELLDSVEWDWWLNEPGLPFSYTQFLSIRKTFRQLKADEWAEQREVDRNFILDVGLANDFVKIEILTYLHTLSALPREKLEALENVFRRDQERICQIKFLWLRLCIKSKWSEKYAPALEFACKYCMPKYACPIFRDLYNFYQTGNSRRMARSWFMNPNNRSQMLPETIKELASILYVELDDRT